MSVAHFLYHEWRTASSPDLSRELGLVRVEQNDCVVEMSPQEFQEYLLQIEAEKVTLDKMRKDADALDARAKALQKQAKALRKEASRRKTKETP